MADLALTATQIAPVFPEKAEIYDMIAAAAITAGQLVYRDANGKADVADANAAGKQQVRGVALKGAAAGQAVSVLRRGHCYGFTITQAYDTPLFLSDTAGAVADAAGTLSVPVGLVDALSDSSITKVVYFDCRFREDYA